MLLLPLSTRVHPASNISLVLQLHASGGYNTYGQEVTHLLPRGWAKVDIFDRHNRVVSGRWKLPVRVLPVRPSLTTGEINTVPQVRLYMLTGLIGTLACLWCHWCSDLKWLWIGEGLRGVSSKVSHFTCNSSPGHCCKWEHVLSEIYLSSQISKSKGYMDENYRQWNLHFIQLFDFEAVQ